jgi:hypothetical protein
LKLDLWFLGRLAIIFMALIILSIGAHAGQENPRVLLIDKMAGWDNLNYLRLLEISAQNGIELELATGFNANPKILDGGYRGNIVFVGGRNPFRNPGTIFHDGNISAWDNEAAAKTLLLWLVQKQQYPDN